MHIHILGICGTFMGGLALLAKAHGYKVTGSDANVYPPMSTQLEQNDIQLTQGFGAEQLTPKPDLVVIGNALSRGNEAVEAVLNQNIPYVSGPQWLAEHLLKDKWVLAASGTHGKTTTSSILAWLLEFAGLKPGFLIGGVATNFGVSARLGQSDYFVIEADEYDSAFFDKRSKFIHYQPSTLIINNMEFDHADIFDDLAAIQKQFHHLVRTVPSKGLILHPPEKAIEETLDKGCWTPTQVLGQDWRYQAVAPDYSSFELFKGDELLGCINWALIGEHNASNALAAIAAAHSIGVDVSVCIDALAQFKAIKRRMELKGVVNHIHLYDDFAHHPTAIETTLAGLRAKVGSERIIAVLEPRSATMKLGVHKSQLADSLQLADQVFIFQPDNLQWSVSDIAQSCRQSATTSDQIEDLVGKIVAVAQANDHILVMSNGGFGGIHQKILDAIEGQS